MKKFLPTLSAIALALPLLAQAGTTSILFDADGTGGAYSPQKIDTLDWAVGNALSVGAVNAINQFQATGVSPTIQLLYQANLGVARLGNTTVAASCSFGAQCFTAVAGFQETVTAILGTPGGTSPNSATFALAPTPGQTAPNSTNFFYVYATPSAPGNDLSGTGFATGTRILSGYVTGLDSSNFSNNGQTALFDQFGTDNYGGKQTVVGSGATDIKVTITGSNANYFPGLMASGLAFSFFNTSAVNPFRQTDPSLQFSFNGMTDGGFASNIGAINGVSGPNFQFQADANQSFVAVPEPGSLALVGLALAGIGFARRRRG